MIVYSVANQKGGVGKTTTAVNLGTALAACGKRVLIVDLDPQGNATSGVGVSKIGLKQSTYSIMVENIDPLEAIVSTSVPGLHLIPATLDLMGAEILLASSEKREFVLRNALSKISNHYDCVLIDTPPSMGILSLNSLIAANRVIVPMQCEYYALEGLSFLIKSIGRIKANFNKNLEISGIVLTLFDGRNKFHELVARDIYQHLPQKVFKTIIPRNIKISESPSHGKPVLIYDLSCSGSRAYISLARELLMKEGSYV